MSSIFSYANAGLAVVVVLGLCLFFHELGHFLAAKASGMLVQEFSMGFGPALWRRQRGETLYAVRGIPFGAYVRIAGMEPGERSGERGFYSRPRWIGAIVLLAGTAMNLVLALLLYWGLNVVSGVPVEGSRAIIIKDVFADTPAKTAGLQAGDEVVAVDGSRCSTEIISVDKGSLADRMGLQPDSLIIQVGDTVVATPMEVVEALKAGSKPGAKIWVINRRAKSLNDEVIGLTPPPPRAVPGLPVTVSPSRRDAVSSRALGVKFGPLDQFALQRSVSGHPGRATMVTVLRQGQAVNLQMTPALATAQVEMVDSGGAIITPYRQVGRLGVALGGETRRAGLVEGFKLAAVETRDAVAMLVGVIRALIAQKVKVPFSGPIAIMARSAETAMTLGWGEVLRLCALISANLALVNQLPIPPFDGFRVALLAVEAAIRRRVDRRLEMIVQIAGVVLVLNLFLYLTYHDIVNLVRYGMN
jgi:membrane-associated protease RseP (regulator of RpoE activity)